MPRAGRGVDDPYGQKKRGGTMSGSQVLEMKGIVKEFFGVRVLDGVDFDLSEGEVHGLVGENGAGKSTLIKILAGYHAKDGGEIILRGRRANIGSFDHAKALGIAFVHQEITSVPFMTVADNMFLGQEPMSRGIVRRIDEEQLKCEASRIMSMLGARIDVDAPMGSLSVAQQQMVMIARAIVTGPRILVLDEPTAALSPVEAESLFSVIRSVVSTGVSVVYISHRLGEVRNITDRITVLRDGRNAGTVNTADVTVDDIARMMIGQRLREYPQRQSEIGEEILSVSNLSRLGSLDRITFGVRAGEILGIVGLVGAGKTELVRALFGADRVDSGTLALAGQRLTVTSPRKAIGHGIGLLPEDRRGQSLILSMTVRENTSLCALSRWKKGPLLDLRFEAERTRALVQDLAVVCTGVDQKVRYLSGGNQQKVAVGKWLLQSGRVFMFDEATQGVDVGAKSEIYDLIRHIAAQGAACLFATSDVSEAIGLCDRLLVMHRGKITKELDPRLVTEDEVLAWAAGKDESDDIESVL